MGYEASSLVVKVLRRWWVVALLMIVVIGLAAWQAASAPTKYRTQILLVIVPDPNLSQTDFNNTVSLLNNRMISATLADTLGSGVVTGPAYASANFPASRVGSYSVRVVNEPDSNAIRVLVEGRRTDEVARLALAMQSSAQAYTPQVYPMLRLNSLQSGDPSVERANLPFIRSIAVAGVVGLGLGVLLALWFDALMVYRHDRRERRLPESRGGTVEMPANYLANDRQPVQRR